MLSNLFVVVNITVRKHKTQMWLADIRSGEPHQLAICGSYAQVSFPLPAIQYPSMYPEEALPKSACSADAAKRRKCCC